jgi:enamine deaminase RidA (YjgF/YER057c/UK114 family)
MTVREIVLDDWSWTADASYAQAVRIGSMIYTSGIAPFDEQGNVVGVGDIDAQIRQTVANLDRVLRAGGSALNHIARQQVFVRRPEDVRAFAELRRELYAPPFPASVLVVVTAQAHPDMLIEIACEAVVPDPSIDQCVESGIS